MESKGRLKKVDRKQRKLQHVITKETNVTCLDTPTNFLAICNAGLISGLSEESIVDHFSKFGIVENIVLLPGKSCSFLSYRETKSAIQAYDNYNGKLNIAQDNKPIYLSYIENLPDYITQNKSFDKKPPGLILIENFVTEQEELELLQLCKFANQMKHRNVQHFGYEFRYDINNVDKDKPLDEAIPQKCDFLLKKLQGFNGFNPDQLTVNQYLPGQGIPAHVDTHSAFEDPIMSLSLQSPIVMEFRNEAEKLHYSVLLPRRSLAVMSQECRYNWTHGITPRKSDVVCSENGFSTFERATRVSFTFRKILRDSECKCGFNKLCDSYRSKSTAIEDRTASELEKVHVHDVYENIATHFSDTRHKAWPNVLEFVQSFGVGSVLVDVGCGNGKYLGHNQGNVFEIGCDRSFGLVDVCKTRGFEAFNANCLHLPLKNNSADAALSIAVIHHLANHERRFRAIKEMVRILKVGGRALIYVWAKDQHKDQEKSSYIKQDRKNRKSAVQVNISDSNEVRSTLVNGVELPVHTNRTQFKHCDVLVPWKLKNNKSEEVENTFLRFYHVFDEGELEELCTKLGNVDIVKNYYDQGNWCIIVEKNK